MLDVVHYRFDHDDGIVYDDADGQHQAEHRESVDREAEHREKNERADKRHGHGEQRDDSRAQVLQEDKNHERDEDDRLDKRMDNSLDGGLHRRRCVIDDLIVHVGGEQRFRLAQRAASRLAANTYPCTLAIHRLRQTDRNVLHRSRPAAANIEDLADGGGVFERDQEGASDVLHADLSAGFSLTENDVLELLGIDEPAGGAHRVGKFLVFR